MTDAAGTSRVALYETRARAYEAERDQLEGRSARLANTRGLSFIGAVIAAIAAAASTTPLLPGVVAALLAGAFVALIVVHGRVDARRDEKARWARVNGDAVLRVGPGFKTLPQDGDRYGDAAAPYLDDLDVFGPGSLFQRVCVAHTRYGQDALAAALKGPAPADEVTARQEAARHLAPELEFRHHLEALALEVVDVPESAGKAASKLTRDAVPDPEPLLKWAEGSPRLLGDPLVRYGAVVLPPITFAGLGLSLVLGMSAFLWIVPLVVQGALLFRVRSHVEVVFGSVSARQGAFTQYGKMLAHAENAPGRGAALDAVRDALRAGGSGASVGMREFEHALGWFEARHSGMVYPVINLFFMWDIHCTLRLERWQRAVGVHARGWFEGLGRLEMLCCLANLAADEPAFTFPELLPGDAGGRYTAEGLGHPLIVGHRVENDVTLPGPGRALLVTGSNMSGKSTLLRAMGLSVVLAMAGGPVCARRLRMTPLLVRSSIRIRDSLGGGVSHFYAEVNKLKGVLDAALTAARGDAADPSPEPPLPVLFLLDEVLHGTNSRERQIGARWVLEQLLAARALGAVSTHDMGLVRLPEAIQDHVELVHFREQVVEDEMTFDYKLRQGPVTAGNALRLMRAAGLAVPVPADGDGAGTRLGEDRLA